MRADYLVPAGCVQQSSQSHTASCCHCGATLSTAPLAPPEENDGPRKTMKDKGKALRSDGVADPPSSPSASARFSPTLPPPSAGLPQGVRTALASSNSWGPWVLPPACPGDALPHSFYLRALGVLPPDRTTSSLFICLLVILYILRAVSESRAHEPTPPIPQYTNHSFSFRPPSCTGSSNTLMLTPGSSLGP